MPRLESVWQEFKDEGLSVIAVEATGNRRTALSFIANSGLTYHFLEDGYQNSRVAGNLYGVEYYPATFLLDGAGTIRWEHIGFRPGDEQSITSMIKVLLAE